MKYTNKYHTYYADDEKINLENFADGKIECFLYRLDKLDDILSANQKILSEIQNTEGGGRNGSESALSNLRTRRDKIEHTIKVRSTVEM